MTQIRTRKHMRKKDCMLVNWECFVLLKVSSFDE